MSNSNNNLPESYDLERQRQAKQAESANEGEKSRLKKYFSYKNDKNKETAGLETEKDADSLYLEQLQFKKKDKKTFLNFFLTNQRVILMLIMIILAWGVYSFKALPLESSPEVKIPYAFISVILPGAGPADVEELVIKKIEKKIANLQGVKKITSTAQNSFAGINVEFRAEEDLKDAIRRLRDAVETAKSDLPTDAKEPVVTEISLSDSPIWTMVMTGPYDSFTLRNYADQLKDELEKLPGSSTITVSGGDVAEYHLSFDPQKLDQYGLTMDQALAVVKANNITLPLGDMTLGNYEYSLRLDGKYHDIQELRDLPVYSDGSNIVRLKDVAAVSEKAAERKNLTKFSIGGKTPENAITINVVKKTGFSIVELVDGGKEVMEKMKKDKFPEQLKIETVYDVSEQIREDFNNLLHEGINTIILVTIILFLFVGLKEAFTAGIVIPLVFSASFGFMLLFGQTLNFLSLFSLILSLGLLVDDAIVVVQATKQYMATGKFTPEEAVLLVFKDFFGIILTTSLTTIFAFFPLVLATGIIGQYIRSIPITTSITLAASTVIAIVINHPMAAILERFKTTRRVAIGIFVAILAGFVATVMAIVNNHSWLLAILAGILLFVLISLLLWYRKSLRQTLIANEDLILVEKAQPEKIREKLRHHYGDHDEKPWWIKATSGVVKVDKILPTYNKILRFFLDSKVNSYLFIVVIVALFAASAMLPISGTLKSEFLPPSDQDLMYINIEGAPGLKLNETKKIADQVEQILLKEPMIKTFSETIGSGGVSTNGASVGGRSSGTGGKTNLAQFAVNLYPLEERPTKIRSYDYSPTLRQKLAGIKGAKITLAELSGGPPSGADFEVRFAGDDLTKLEELANHYKELLKTIPGTVNQDTSIRLSPGEFTFKLKPEEMALHGITPAQIAATLRTAISGAEVTKILKGEDDVSVQADYNEAFIPTLDAVRSISLTNTKGQKFQLGDVADIEVGSSLTSISRIDQKRVVVLSASVVKPQLPGEVVTEFKKILVKDPLPQGYEAIFGGQNDSTNESILSIIRAMSVAFLLIIATMVIQFNSFRKAIMVLFTIPLAMTGVFTGLTLVGYTLSFPALIGVLALFGIVVKNAIILMDKINLNLKVGISFKEAILDAARSRLEAIFLTTSATVIGMIPITLYDETWEGLGASLIFGLITSTVLTLVLVPTVFNLMFEKDAARAEKIKQLQHE